MSSIAGTSNGTAVNASSYTAKVGVLTLDNSTANATRLNTAATMTLASSGLTIAGNASAATAESVATLNVSGGSIITLSPNAAQSLRFTSGTLNRTGDATFLVNAQVNGATLGGTPGAAGNATLLFSNLSAGSNTNGVLPYGFAQTGTGSSASASLVRYDATRGVVPLNTTTDYDARHLTLVGSLPTTNYKVGATFGQGVGNVSGSRTVNALLLETPTVATIGNAIFGTGTITLTSGALVTSLTGGTQSSTIVGAVIQPNLALGSTTGYFHTQADTFIAGNLTSTAGLVK